MIERVDGSVEMMEFKDIFQTNIDKRDDVVEMLKEQIEYKKDEITEFENKDYFSRAMEESHRLAELYSELEIAFREQKLWGIALRLVEEKSSIKK